MIESLSDINRVFLFDHSDEFNSIITSRVYDGDALLFREGPTEMFFYKDGAFNLVVRSTGQRIIRGHFDYMNYEEYSQYDADLKEDWIIDPTSVIITSKEGGPVNYDFDWISGYFEIFSKEPKLWVQYDILTEFSWAHMLEKHFSYVDSKIAREILIKRKFNKFKNLVI